MIIRSEQGGDEQAIYDVTQAAFAPMFFSDGTEGQMINDLRRDGDLVISLVAVDDSGIVGHVALSPATIDGEHDGWFGLGPLSVSPRRQLSGIGGKLIAESMRLLKLKGATGCVLTGDPDYYARFGFRNDGALTYRDENPRNVLWLSFKGDVAKGCLKFSPALEQ